MKPGPYATKTYLPMINDLLRHRQNYGRRRRLCSKEGEPLDIVGMGAVKKFVRMDKGIAEKNPPC